MARSVFQYEQPRCPDNWNEAERRFYNRLIETLDDIYSKYGRLDEKMLSKGVLNRIDNSTATSLEKMTADILSSGKIAADSIEATFAYLVSLSAKYGSFDFETVKNLVADAMVLEKGQADYVHITNLAATYAQAVNATIGNLVIQSSDGKYYQLDVSADGKVSASEVKPSDKEISAGETSEGKVIVGTHITAETLGTATLAATQALINMIDASRINVDTLVAREEFVQTLTANEAFVDSLVANTAFIKQLGTTTIVGDKSITMLAGEAEKANAKADELDRLSNIEVIEGTFAQTERREGEGIRIYSEIGPKQDLSNGDPSPDNICPIEGWTRLNAFAGGKNLCGGVGDVIVQNNALAATMTQNGNVFTLSTTSEYGGDGFLFGYGVFKKGKKYTVSGTVAEYVNVRIYDKTNMNMWLHLITPDANGNFALTFEATSDDVVFRVWVSVSAACTLSNFQIEEGDLTPYVPYQGNTYFLDFGKTVYGGTVDWHAGEMTVTREVLVLDGSENWANGYISNGKDNRFELTLRDKKYGDPSIANGSLNVLCNAFACQKTIGLPGAGKFRISQDYSVNNGLFILFNPPTSLIPLEDVSAWKAWLAANPVQVEMPLYEPYTIQLTTVQIETLQGINTVYTDADGGRVEFGHSPIEDIQNAVDALEEAQAESALYLKLDAENKVVRIGQTEVTSEFDIDAYGAGVMVGGQTVSRFEASRMVFEDMEMRKPANIGGLAFDSIMKR